MRGSWLPDVLLLVLVELTMHPGAVHQEPGPTRTLPTHRQDEDDVLVRTMNGAIRGTLMQLPSGARVAAFLGIPYAEPPLGERRFKASVPKKQWNGTFNATAFGPLCPQDRHRVVVTLVPANHGGYLFRRVPVRHFPQSENCLSLNVYVPWEFFPNDNDNGSEETHSLGAPVMVYIHGGSYQISGGLFYHGEWLASAGGVVVVTLNYRLGALGFLSTGDNAARGNYGLLDQVLALKWVKTNIRMFGGNRDQVTIFGNSAGGASVVLHLVSPLSRGLFSSAITQSGSAIARWAVQRNPRPNAQRLAHEVRCTKMSYSDDVVNCMRGVPAEEIVRRSGQPVSVAVSFAPVVDGKFLPDYPEALIYNSQFHQVPLLTGFTKDEVSVWMNEYNDPSSAPLTKARLKKYLRHLLLEGATSEANIGALVHAVYTEYTSKVLRGNGRVADVKTLAEIISDVGLKAPCIRMAQMWARRSQKPIFLYEFDYASADDYLLANNSWLGAYHESELHYLLGLPYLGIHNALRLQADRKMSDIMLNLWMNFIRFGNPTPEGKHDRHFNFTWRPFTPFTENYAVLDTAPSASRDYQPARMAFWNDFVPLFTDFGFAPKEYHYYSFKTFISMSAVLSGVTLCSTSLLCFFCYRRCTRPGVVLARPSAV